MLFNLIRMNSEHKNYYKLRFITKYVCVGGKCLAYFDQL